VSKGQSLAVLGASGAGKTTLIGLLTGLRSPNRGHVSVDGIDLRQLNLEHYRNRVGLVTKAEFIEGTILDNLRLERADIALDKIHQVLAALGLEDDIAKLEHGLDTPLTAFGAPLSTTQAQRMMLARAIIGEPDIMMIDGLLDTLNRQELAAVLALLKQNASAWMLIVTTRLPEIAQQFQSVIALGPNAEDNA
jgi:ABC-type bacteriocin/lantibiotic exporter with double-glycine peptidase domain